MSYALRVLGAARKVRQREDFFATGQQATVTVPVSFVCVKLTWIDGRIDD
jgi:hypothetical protein